MEFHTGNPLLSRPGAYLFLARLRESLRDGPLEKLWRGEGNFRAAGIFFRYQIPCMNFFQALARIFLKVNWRARIFLN